MIIVLIMVSYFYWMAEFCDINTRERCNGGWCISMVCCFLTDFNFVRLVTAFYRCLFAREQGRGCSLLWQMTFLLESPMIGDGF